MRNKDLKNGTRVKIKDSYIKWTKSKLSKLYTIKSTLSPLDSLYVDTALILKLPYKARIVDNKLEYYKVKITVGKVSCIRYMARNELEVLR